jgi:hypothetical protein
VWRTLNPLEWAVPQNTLPPFSLHVCGFTYAAVGGLVLIAVILAVIVVRRRILRRRGPSPPIPTVLLPPPPPAVHGAHYPPPPIAPYPSAPLPLLSSVAPNGGATGGSGTANGYPVAGYYANGTGGSSGRQYNGHDPYLAAAAAVSHRVFLTIFYLISYGIRMPDVCSSVCTPTGSTISANDAVLLNMSMKQSNKPATCALG